MLKSITLTVMLVWSLLVQGAKEDCKYCNVTTEIQNQEELFDICIGVVHSTHMLAKAHAITDLRLKSLETIIERHSKFTCILYHK